MLCILVCVDSMYLSETLSELDSIDDVTDLLRHCQASISIYTMQLVFDFLSVCLDLA